MIKNTFMLLFLMICFLALISCEGQKSNDVSHIIVEQEPVSLPLDLKVGQQMELYSDTLLRKEPSYSADRLEYLQYAKVEILSVKGDFVQVKTVDREQSKEGWISTWSLHDDSTDVQYYMEEDPLRLASASARLFSSPVEQATNDHLPVLVEGQPLRISRVYQDYYEVQLLGADGKHYSQLWIFAQDVRPFDPDRSRQGILEKNVAFELPNKETIILAKREMAWMVEEVEGNKVTVKLQDGRVGTVEKIHYAKYILGNELDIDSRVRSVHVNAEHYPPEADHMPYVIRVSSNHHLDSVSVEEAIFSSLQYNRFTDVSNRLKIEIKWEDPSQFSVYFYGLQFNNSVHFSIGEGVTKRGVKLREADPPTYSFTSITVTLLDNEFTNIHLTKLPDFKTESVSLPRIIDYRMINVSDEDRRFMAYASDRSSYTLVHPANLDYERIPQLTSLPAYSTEADVQSYFQEIAADRWEKEKFYVVVGTKILYYYDYEKKAGRKLFVAEKPIYNVSVSPDFNRIALLVSQEEMAHPHADLIILNTAGKVVFQEKIASNIPHSDGIWSFYPMEWLDRDTVRVQSEIEIAGEQHRSFGYKDFRVSTGELSVAKIPAAKWNEDATALHLSETGEWISIDSRWRHLLKPFYGDTELRYYPSPENTYAILAYMQQLFVYDHHSKSMEWIGEGSFVEWTENHSFLWLQGYNQFIFF